MIKPFIQFLSPLALRNQILGRNAATMRAFQHTVAWFFIHIIGRERGREIHVGYFHWHVFLWQHRGTVIHALWIREKHRRLISRSDCLLAREVLLIDDLAPGVCGRLLRLYTLGHQTAGAYIPLLGHVTCVLVQHPEGICIMVFIPGLVLVGHWWMECSSVGIQGCRLHRQGRLTKQRVEIFWGSRGVRLQRTRLELLLLLCIHGWWILNLLIHVISRRSSITDSRTLNPPEVAIGTQIGKSVHNNIASNQPSSQGLLICN